MALLVSTWSKGIQSVPKDYIMPPEHRPGDFGPVCKEIPVIDLQEKLGTDRSDIVQQLLNACQELGVFQVINHGVSEKMMEDMRNLYDEFFGMPVEDKMDVYADKFGMGCRLYPSGLNYAKEETHFWKDTLKHSCFPLEEHTPTWPQKPNRYRDEVGRYSMEVRKMALKVLNLIAEGLGLEDGYFEGELIQEQAMSINHYPRCPDPSLTMGISAHTDPNLITFIQQDHYGLQIHKDGQWMGVDPIPNAFVVNLGYQLQIVSNGKLICAEHRAITNSTSARTTIGTFFSPKAGLPGVIGPAKELVTSSTPQSFKSVRYIDFLQSYMAYFGTPIPRIGTPLDPYKL